MHKSAPGNLHDSGNCTDCAKEEAVIEALEYALEQFKQVSERHGVKVDVIPIEDTLNKLKGV